MRPPSRVALWIAGAGFVALHAPLVLLMLFSVNRSRLGATWEGASLVWYARLLERRDLLDALRASLVVGAASTLAATVLGTLLAVGLARAGRLARATDLLLIVPLAIPEVVAGISLLLLFAGLGIPLGLTTITVAHVAFALPFVTLVVQARLAGLDWSPYEAALSLGADERAALRHAILPQLWPGIAAAALLAFTLSFDDFVITFFVAGAGSTTLPLLVYGMARRAVEPTVNALSTLMLLVTTALVALAAWLHERR